MTTESFWTASARSKPFDGERAAAEESCDVVIVGGGFTSLSAALHIAEKGAKVSVLEAHEIGYGASGRNGGQVNPGLKHDAASLRAKFGEKGLALYRMGQQAPDFLFDLVERLDIDCGMRRSGLIRLAHNARALKSLRAAGRTLAQEGAPVDEIGAEDVKRLVGTMRYPGGLIDRRGGSVQPLDLVRGLAHAAKAKGVRIFERSRATAMERANGHWTILTPEARFRAQTVIVATNGYTDSLVPRLVRSIIPVNSFQIATAPLPSALGERILPEGHTVYDSRRLVLYFRRSANGGMLLGGRASFASKLNESARLSDYAVLTNVLTDAFPDLKGIPIEHRWTGLACVTPDFLPHYHQPEENLHVMLGYNGRGVAMSNRAGAWLANKVANIPDEGWFPETPIRTLPFHTLRQPVLNVAMQFNRVLDHFGY